MDIPNAMADAWDKWSREPSFPFARQGTTGYCINATRIGVEALRVLGIKAKPASVQMLILNAAADQLARAGVPTDRWPEHAHSLGLGMGDDFTPGAGWDGHLVIDGFYFTLDLSGEAYARPGRITLDGPLVLPPLPALGERKVWKVASHVIVVDRAPHHNAWRSATGWTRRHREHELELVARTRSELGAPDE